MPSKNNCTAFSIFLCEQKVTMVVVTHEMRFARDVSNHVIFMNGGEIAVSYTHLDVYKRQLIRKVLFYLKNNSCFYISLQLRQAEHLQNNS